MAIYLSSFYPLGCTLKGERAIKKYYKETPYIDGSCRREPDFLNDNPAITGLCRTIFAKKLRIGDKVIYTTNKKRIGSRKIVAVLEVIDTKDNHEGAADWYRNQKAKIPNNLMVGETKPFNLEETHQMGKWGQWGLSNTDLEGWNRDYVDRANDYPHVAICKIIYKELRSPVILTDDEMYRIFTRRPGTRNPGKIEETQWLELKKLLNYCKD